ncbi:fused MFS/spermidine synthase [Chloroflexota bacterium]
MIRHNSALWRASAIAFSSSFCVMVIELIAARILAPYIGVSLYTWTSIIGVVLTGIALGNYLGGKIADRYASPVLLMAIFLAGALATIAVLPATKAVGSSDLFSNLPVMLNFTLKTTFIFFLPAIILSMVSPLVIKLTLADLGKTGGVVGTIYACSTAGSILGTFLTGFFFILWFGTRTIVWLVAGVLILTGIISWLSWKIQGRWKFSLKNLAIWLAIVGVILASGSLCQFRVKWQESFTKESNYYSIRVLDAGGDFKMLVLDHLIHSYVIPDRPMVMRYEYLRAFEEILRYTNGSNEALRVLHLGGGGYSFPRYLEAVYPGSVNEVVEIDPAVTQVAHQELGLPMATSIKTYNQDARLFLIQRKAGEKYDYVVGDVFNDFSTPYHLTTLEFDRLVKANMTEDGIYLLNIIDDYQRGRYMPSLIYTLKRVFTSVYLFGMKEKWGSPGRSTFVIVATDRCIDLAHFERSITENGARQATSYPHDEAELEQYLAEGSPLLLTDDYAPTDILVVWRFR